MTLADSRRTRLAYRSLPEAESRVATLVHLAQRGIHLMNDGPLYPQTVRGIRSDRGVQLRPEGDNLRYAAIVALGASRLPHASQHQVLGGIDAVELAESVVYRAKTNADLGAKALAAWAAAEIANTADEELFGQIVSIAESGAPLAVVDSSWAVTAGVAARKLIDTSALTEGLANRLAAAQGPTGTFPHMMPADSLGRLRAHVGCFADQVYPIQAFSRLAVATGHDDALRAANSCAQRICDAQGEAGQWWWHYDSRTGSVVERFPVYSVHQHAMAPMALFDLLDAGGDDHVAEVALGLDWLYTHPEVMGDLISAQHGLVWRKVGRREPPKAARSLAAVTSALHPSLRPPALDRVFPANRIDYECRPYELGWLLYAWLSDTSPILPTDR